MGYVSEYGNWGLEQVLFFDNNALTPEQVEKLDEQTDSQKMSYVKAILNGEDLSYWEN